MKKIIKILVSILAVIAIIIGGWKVKEQVEYNQMVEIVKSEEVQEKIKDDLRELDSQALSEEGKIKTYTIDKNTIRHSPMGGIKFIIYVNDDKNKDIHYSLLKNTSTNEYSSTMGVSLEIQNLVNLKE